MFAISLNNEGKPNDDDKALESSDSLTDTIDLISNIPLDVF